MSRSRDRVRAWAEAILAQLGAPAGHTLSVTGPGLTIDADAGTHADATALEEEFNSSLSITPNGGRTDGDSGSDVAGLLVTLSFPDDSSVSVHFEQPMTDPEAVTLLADQLQDAVLEETGGAANPPCPCPGHDHPAVAQLVDGTACWTCPSGGDAVWPILPTS